MKQKGMLERVFNDIEKSQTGAKTRALYRRCGITEPKFFDWNARPGCLTKAEANRLRELEADIAGLKRLFVKAESDKYKIRPLVQRNT